MGAVNLELVDGAALPPHTCMFCACNPKGEHGETLPFVTAVGMDINWGETPYICATCCGIIADLIDRPARDKVEKVLKGARAQKKHNTELVGINEQLRLSLEGVIAGETAVEDAKELLSVYS